MMVRFSDIIKKKDKQEPARRPPKNSVEEDELRLSDSQISKILRDSQVPKTSLVKDEDKLRKFSISVGSRNP